MNVVLIGYRGTGKSSVASLVARRLDLGVLSLDSLIVEDAGKSIPEIVAERGWPGFRDIEERVCRSVTVRKNFVIDCGGGVVEREANFEPLRKVGPVFWLQASVPVIVHRIERGSERPALTGNKSFTEEVAEVLERRTPLYRRLAHYEVFTDGRSIESVADEIAARARDHWERGGADTIGRN